MKTKLCILLFAVLILGACSSDDDDSGMAIPENPTSDYLPLTLGNQWDYDNVLQQEGEGEQQSTETLKVSDSTKMDQVVSYQFSSEASNGPKGLFTSFLTNGSSTKVEGKVIYNGAFQFDLPQLDTPISLSLQNLVVYDQNENSGQVLSTITDSITKTITFNNVEVPVNFHFKLVTSAGDVFETHLAGDQNYDDVISSNFTLSVSASAEFAGVSFEFLVNQKAVNSTNYFAKDVGLILSQNEISVEFEDLSEYNLPELDDIHATSSQTLAGFSLN